jgi:transposase
MSESTNIAKDCISEALIHKDLMKKIENKPAQNKVVEYFISEKYCTYENTDLKCDICYSTTLEGIKKKTTERQVEKEKEAVQKLSKSYSKRPFACKEDSNKEISKLIKKT